METAIQAALIYLTVQQFVKRHPAFTTGVHILAQPEQSF
jgi:hypothetical protein